MQKTAYWVPGITEADMQAKTSLMGGFRRKKDPSIRKVLLAMKLTILILTVALMQVNAAGFSQTVTLSGKQLSLKEVFTAVKKQTGYSLFANRGDLALAKEVSVSVKDMPLESFMELILKDQPLDYVFKGNTIVLSLKQDMLTSLPVDADAGLVVPFVTVRGKVVDQDNNPMKGVSVIVKGTQIGTQTDENGVFVLNNVDQNATLEFTFVGYVKKTLKLGSQTSDLVIVLTPEVKSMEEMVMVGYGSSKRKDLTGSVSSVKAEEIKNTPLVTIDQALAGKASGVMVTSSDGSPGSVARIRIRGGTSLIGGNDPLYIIDGVQVNISNQYIGAGAEITNPIESIGGSSRDPSRNQTIGSSFGRGLNTLAGLNINDIESIDILKDASATAIYGSRAANGVIIITTKKGRRNEKPLLEANYYYGLSTVKNESVLNAQQYREIMLKGARNLNERLAAKSLPADPAATAYLNDPSLLGTADINWLDLVTRVGETHNADISIRGGGTGSSYYMSLNYNKSTGTLLGTDFSRFSGKINLTNELGSKMRLIVNLNLGVTENNLTNGLYGAALLAPPTFEPYNPDGTLSLFPDAVFPGSTSTSSGIRNPLAMLKSTNFAENNMFLGSMALEYDIINGLRFRSSASINYNGSHQVTYQPSITPYVNTNLGAVPGNTGVGSQAQSHNRDLFFENTLSWDKQFNPDNRISVLAGTSWQKTSAKRFAANGQTYPDDDFLNGLSSAAVYLQPTAGEEYASLLSFYLRANYALKERYLLTITGRSDASSKFPEANRVGYFPSFGVAWRINEESFLRSATWLDELKLRLSAGYTGTQNIGNNMFYTLYTPAAYAGTNAMIPSQLGNDRIKWESTLQKDLGLDISLWNGRLSSAIGLYEKYTEGLLMADAVAQSSGFSQAIVNKADIRNRGWEVELRGEIVRGKNVSWNMGLNISGNRSKLEKINRVLPNALSLGHEDPVGVGEMAGNYALIPGQPVGQFYGAIYMGIIKTQEELDSYIYHPVNNPYGLIYTIIAPLSNTIGIGSPRYQTTGEAHGSNTLAPQITNRTVIGSSNPKFFGGMTHTVNYKQFSLIANFSYSYGGNILYLYESSSLGLATLTNKSTRILLPTYQDDPNSDRPILYLKESNTAPGAGASTQNIFDASYIKLKSVNISYALPTAWVSKAGLKSGLVYVSGSNIFTITKYPGPDPEVSNDPYSLFGGNTDDGTYPQTRQYTFGLRFTF
ncbi:MAG TPA: TonB-dependent receptor [Parasegetibacter sp.]